MPFKIPQTPTNGASSPEALFRALPRTPEGPPHLWSHQADLLRSYHDAHVETPDVALELPTGAGKTLVASLIAEWRRRERNERVVYCCPTRQLARQASTHATRYGVEVVTLSGASTQWSQADLLRYRNADVVAVSTYSHIFNSNPRLHDADTLILDDAHSGGDFVADAWTIEAQRDDGLYEQLLATISPHLDPLLAQRLNGPRPEPSRARTVDIVSPRLVYELGPELAQVLDRAVQGRNRFVWRMLRGQLSSCFLYLSWDSMSMRPYVPPSAFHSAFADPSQRVYISATLGIGGELERAFGKPDIARLPIPEGWDEQGIGRRFFLFPELSDAGDQEIEDFVRSTVADQDRVVLMAPDDRTMETIKDKFLPDDSTAVSAAELEAEPDMFTSHPRAALCLSNRYDGIDLPDHSCRLIVMVGLPRGIGLQERFLVHSVGASGVLRERERTRVVQGAGRCTRNPNDFAAIIFLGEDLVQFCGRKDVQESTHREIQAELRFGIDNSMQPLSEFSSLLGSFLTQDEEWRTLADPAIVQQRAALTVNIPSSLQALANAVRYEVEAFESAWRGEWDRAIEKGRLVLDRLEGGAELRPYQALWNFFISEWAAIAYEAGLGAEYQGMSAELQTRAYAASRGTTWIQWSTHRDESAETEEDVLAEGALDEIQGQLSTLEKGSALQRVREELLGALSAGRANEFAAGLETLGRLLGASESYRPEGDAAPDCVWIFGSEAWIAWEAKNEKRPEAGVEVKDVRQSNTHLQFVAEQREESIPLGSKTIIVPPKSVVSDQARKLAASELRVLAVEEVVQLARETVDVWESARMMRLAGQATQRGALRERFGGSRLLGVALMGRLDKVHVCRASSR